MKELPVLLTKYLFFWNVCGPYVIMRNVNFGTVWNTIYYATLLNVLMKIYKQLNLCFAIKTISSHPFLIKIAAVVLFTCKLFSHLQ